VWGWDDGSGPPTDHAGSGTPLPWREALLMPGARQMQHVADFMTSIDFWKLRPAPTALTGQPGQSAANQFIAVAGSAERDLLVAYTPLQATIQLAAGAVPRGAATWGNPRTGARSPASGITSGAAIAFEPPGEGDWLLIVTGTAR